jgi:acylphosphatase
MMTEQEPGNPVRIHIWVTGHVQGVGFRAFVQQSGVQFGLTGWVRNLGYDTVETVAEGSRDKLVDFAKAVKNGPRAARVNEARMEWELATGEFQNFGVKYSA